MLAKKNFRFIFLLFSFFYPPTNIWTHFHKPIIKVCIKNSNPTYEKYWQQLKKIWPSIEKFGLILTDKKPYDVILCSEITDDILNQSQPIIACDPIDCCVVMPEILKHIKNPKIKAIFKNFGAQPRSINNLPRVYWSHHFKILNDLEYFAEPTIYKQLSRSMLYKIKTVPWAPEMSLINDGLQKLKTQHIDFTKQRNIDVFFAGRTLYNIPGSEVQQIFQHRKKAIEAIANIKDIKSVIIENSILTHDKYVEQMKNAKIAISPWGYGEWCWRDFEGMLCGTIVIKPYCPYIDYPKKIYLANKTYIPCKPDFSDLEEKICKVLKNWNHYTTMRKFARKRVLDTTINDFAKHFALHVQKALNTSY